MTPEQKEAYDIAERGYRIALCDGKTHVTLTRERLRTLLDALAANQPAPAIPFDQKAQGLRCSCRGTDDWCVCQNVPDRETLKAHRGEPAPTADTGQAVGFCAPETIEKLLSGKAVGAASISCVRGNVYTVPLLYAHPAPLDVERVGEAAPIWGKWYPHNEAPRGSYPCLYQKGNAPVSLAWMPAQGRPNMPDTVVMPFRMPSDKGAL